MRYLRALSLILSALLCCGAVYDLGCQVAYGQSDDPISSAEQVKSEGPSHPIPSDVAYFTTDIDEDSPLVLFNLLSFTSSSEEWSGVEVEAKFPVDRLDQLFIKRVMNTSNLETKGQINGFLPPIDYQVVGKLMAKTELVKPFWVIWVPNASSKLSPGQTNALKQLINTLRNEADPEGQVAIFQGDLLPALRQRASRVADLKLDLAPAMGDKGINNAPLNFNAEGLGELLAAVKLQQGQIDMNDRPPEVRYSCGRSCRELIPSTRIIILHDQQQLNLPQSVPESYSSLFQSLHYPKHLLYRAEFFFVMPDSVTTQKSLSPSWLTSSSPSEQSHLLMRGNLESFSDYIKVARHRAHTTYYSIQPLVVPQYYWVRESIDISTRISLGEQSFVQRAQLHFSFDDRQSKRDRRQAIYDEYRTQLDELRGKIMAPQPLSFMTRLVIGILWAGLCLAVLSIMIVRLRRHRSSTSEPALEIDIETQAIDATEMPQRSSRSNEDPFLSSSKNQTESSSLSSESLLPDWTQHRDPAEYARQKRREREQSIKIHKPSQASPMVNPEDPSTVPAPAAEAKISSQPVEAEETLSSTEPKPQELGQDIPVERLDIISDVLSLDSAPPLNAEESSPSTQKGSTPPTAQPIAGLYAERGPMRRYFFLISDFTATIGRSPYNNCALPPDGDRSDRQISREHFELSRIHEERWEIRCKSPQGLILNQTLINQGESAMIQDKDLIIIGDTYLRFRSSTAWRTFQVREQLKMINSGVDNLS